MDGLTGLRRADAAIVGCGLTGLLLGSSLSQAGLRVILLDAGDGTFPPFTAQASVLCAPAYQRIETAWDMDTARIYASSLQTLLAEMLTAPPPYVKDAAAYIYARQPDDLPPLEKQLDLLTRLNIPVSIAPDAGGCPFPVELSLTAPGQAFVEMPRWMTALRRSIRRHGGSVFDHSPVIDVDSTRVCTAQGCVEAPVIVFAAGIPLKLRSTRLLSLLERRLLTRCVLRGDFPLYNIQMPVQTDELALCPTASGAAAVWDTGRCGTRRQQDRLARFEHILSHRMPDWQAGPLHYAYETYSADGLPLIGALPDTRHLCAAGYGGHGILSAMHAAAVLTRHILGRAIPEDRLYAPDRAVPHRILRPRMRRLAGIYAKSILRRNAPSCTHCGCRMRYSTAIHRWECPFCGSVYDMLGQVTDGPATSSASLSIRQRPDL